MEMAAEIINQSLERQYDVTRGDLLKDKLMLHGAWVAPVTLTIVPAAVLFILALLSAGAPPMVATFIFFGVVALIVGFLSGLVVSGGFMVYRQKWLKQLRERIAIDGIKGTEVDWFRHELTSGEKRGLKELQAANPLMADAYKDTLASRLTATRIIKTTKQELALVKRRQLKLKAMKSDVSTELVSQLEDDRKQLEDISSEAKQMKIEAETRLEMIEAAVRRGTSFADTELTLKKLTARSQELPLALEALKMEEELRRELMAGEALKELDSGDEPKN